jgi:hypothetical protein
MCTNSGIHYNTSIDRPHNKMWLAAEMVMEIVDTSREVVTFVGFCQEEPRLVQLVIPNWQGRVLLIVCLNTLAGSYYSDHLTSWTNAT